MDRWRVDHHLLIAAVRIQNRDGLLLVIDVRNQVQFDQGAVAHTAAQVVVVVEVRVIALTLAGHDRLA